MCEVEGHFFSPKRRQVAETGRRGVFRRLGLSVPVLRAPGVRALAPGEKPSLKVPDLKTARPIEVINRQERI